MSLTIILKTTRLSKILTLKVLKINNNKMLRNNKIVDKIVKILSKLKNTKNNKFEVFICINIRNIVKLMF